MMNVDPREQTAEARAYARGLSSRKSPPTNWREVLNRPYTWTEEDEARDMARRIRLSARIRADERDKARALYMMGGMILGALVTALALMQ